MKKLAFFLLASFIVVTIANAQSIITRIDQINVNFDNKTAQITRSQGYYDNSGNWQQTGIRSTDTLQEPGFDSMLNTLSNANALNLNEVETVIQNTI